MKIIPKLMIAGVFFFMGIHVHASPIPDWEFTGKEDGIVIYKKEIPGSSLLAFKGEGEIEAPIERVAAVIFDTSRAPEWVVDLDSSKIVRWISKNEFIEYDHIKTPPIIMKDREFISKVNLTIHPVTKEMRFQYKSADAADLPAPDKFIRGELMSTTFILTPVAGNTKTRVVGEIHCDPKGSVPKWMVNFYQKNWPTDTLKNLRKQVAKTDIKIDQKITSLFAAQ